MSLIRKLQMRSSFTQSISSQKSNFRSSRVEHKEKVVDAVEREIEQKDQDRFEK